MKRKIGTVMEERLLFGAKKAAIEKDVPLSRIFEEAVEAYLESLRLERDRGESVRATRGMFRLTEEEILETLDEAGILES
jgi:hypothetical protein